MVRSLYTRCRIHGVYPVLIWPISTNLLMLLSPTPGESRTDVAASGRREIEWSLHHIRQPPWGAVPSKGIK
jgi:hypothetical protein